MVPREGGERGSASTPQEHAPQNFTLIKNEKKFLYPIGIL
jgi:hypothetical protein